VVLYPSYRAPRSGGGGGGGGGQAAAFVRAHVPGAAAAVLVAGQAGLVALVHGLEGVALEAVDGQRLLAALGGVAGAGAVAGLALQAAGAKGRVRVAAVRVFALEQRRRGIGRRLVVVAFQAGVSTFLGVGAFGRQLGRRGLRISRRQPGQADQQYQPRPQS
jgi:hypothetical protein